MPLRHLLPAFALALWLCAACQATPTPAASPTESVPVTSTLSPTLVSPTVTAPPPTLAPPPTADSPAGIVAEVRALTGGWAAPYLRGEGWLHVVTGYDRDYDTVGTFSDGQPIPLDYDQDTWSQLDAQNRAMTVISLMRDASGQVLQTDIYQDGHWRHTTAPGAPPRAAEPRPVSLDLNFVKQLEAALAEGHALFRAEEVAADGRPLVSFGFRNEFAAAQAVGGSDVPAVAVAMRLTVERATGQPLWFDTTVFHVDGTERLSDHVELRLVEHTPAPPPEILAHLDPPTALTLPTRGLTAP